MTSLAVRNPLGSGRLSREPGAILSDMEKILAVATNDATVLKDHKTGLWLSELTHVLDVVVKAGYGYDLASPAGGKIPLDEGSIKDGSAKDAVNARFMDSSEFLNKLEYSIPCAEVVPAGYAAIFLSGGHGTMFDFRQSPALSKLLTTFYAAGRPVAAVCHGVSGLLDAVDADGTFLVKGKVVTGFSNVEDTLAGVKALMPFLLEDALKEQGATYRKNLVPFTERVETDGLLITGQNPQSARAVGTRLVEALRAKQAAG
jgi:putative intracellular protease/amidase